MSLYFYDRHSWQSTWITLYYYVCSIQSQPIYAKHSNCSELTSQFNVLINKLQLFLLTSSELLKNETTFLILKIKPKSHCACVTAPDLGLHFIWWRLTGSNRSPPACKAGALPDELNPRNSCLPIWWVWLGSNQRPPRYQHGALTN